MSTGSQTITLPDFKDQEAALVYAKLTELGLKYETVQETSSTIAEGNVTQTSPGMNETVVSGDTITVFVSTGTGKEKVVVPDVMTYDLRDAEEMLEDAGLKASVTYEASTLDYDTVINQNPKHPARLDIGSTVYLTVASDEVIPTADYKMRVFFTTAMQESGDTYRVQVQLDGVEVYSENIDPAEQRSIMIPLTGEGSSIADVYIDGSLYQSFEVNFEEGTSSLLADNKDNF